MNLRKSFIIGFLILLMGGQAFAQQPAANNQPSHKYRTVLTIAGAGAGFATGFYIGFNAYDDAVNSERKLWTTSIIMGAAGAVGGFLTGRAIDIRRNRIIAERLNVTPVVSKDTKGVQLSFRF